MRRRMVMIPQQSDPSDDIKMKFRRRNYHYCQNNVSFFQVSCILILSSLCWISGAEMICQHGIKSFTGVTYPPGDIILTQGDTLDVYCSVNLTHPLAKGYNASNLEFKVGRQEIPDHLIQKSIVNETTIRMKVDNMNSSIIYLDCIVRKDDGSSVQVCQNHVEVGLPPLPPEDFSCIAWNWTKLVCTWTRPFNTIKTKYNLSFMTHMRKDIFSHPCPQIIDYANETSSCEWYRDSPYRPNQKFYYMRLNGTNALNKTGVIWSYNYHHFSIVVPEPPKIERFVALTSNKLLVNYTFKNFEYFAPGLEHEIVLCDAHNVCDITTLETDVPTYFVEREIEVPYAYTSYRVTIRMRSKTANKTELFWSSPASAKATTMAKIPDSPPTTDIGNFEIHHEKSGQRDVYIYWEDIPMLMKNGPNFHYEAVLYKNGHKIDDVSVVETNRTYTKFLNLDDNAEYTVQLYAVNDLGRSLENSTVEIPTSQKGRCYSDTNLTAKVRAIESFEGNSDLFREWSQDGYESCQGDPTWITLTTISVVLIFVLIAAVFGTIKCWSCCNEMRDIEVKLPPGLESQLNPFSQVHGVKRKNSVEDVQTFGKETTAYPLKYTPSNNLNEEHGILQSSKNNKEAEDCLIDSVGTHMMPQSALNPLLAATDRGTTDDEDILQPERNRLPPPADPYTKLGMFSNENSVLPDDNRTVSVSPVPANFSVPSPPRNNDANNVVQNGFSPESSPGSSSSTLSPSSPEKLPTTSSRIVPDVLTPHHNNASYVKWTQLLPEFKNDTSISTRQTSSPYCQVGII